jgi:heme/copper-type cytochrome/quinol oxidase subunit 3
VSYFYLLDRASEWPPPPIALPALGPGTLTLAVLLASVAPMIWLERAAKRLDTRAVIAAHAACDVFGLALIAARVFELAALDVRWDANAYGSIVWMILGVHTFHLVSEIVETFVLTWLFVLGHTSPKYFVDSTDNALYWYFIVAIWVPCYAVIYLAPRMM